MSLENEKREADEYIELNKETQYIINSIKINN